MNNSYTHSSYKPSAASQIVFDGRNRILLENLRACGLREDAAIIDVGCGRGDMLRLLRNKGYKNLFGIDIDSQCVVMASQFATVKEGGAEKIDLLFPEMIFDAIICSHVLEHVPNPLETLKNIASKGAMLALAVPNALSIGNIAKAFINIIPPVNTGHLQLWDTAHFLNFLDTAGLELIKPPQTEFVSLFPYKSIQRLLGEKAVIALRGLDFIGFKILPRIFPKLGISVICTCRRKKCS